MIPQPFFILRLFALMAFTFLFNSNIGFTQSNATNQYLYKTGSKDSLHSTLLNENRDFWIQLPEGYTGNPSQKYPVIYILDGSVHLRATATAYEYYQGHHLPDMILVGISNQSNRTRDLTISKVESRNGGPINTESGGAENFHQFIEKELIPYIDKKYPTTSFKTLVGHSFGGLFALHSFINHTQTFNNYIAIDPSIDWDDQKILKQFEQVNDNRFEGKSLFVSLASAQIHRNNNQITLENVMQDSTDETLFTRSILQFSELAKTKADFNFSFNVYPKDYHWSVPLPSIQDALVEQFKWYQLEIPAKFNAPSTPLDTLIKLVKNREHKLEQHFGYKVPPAVEELFNQGGYLYLQMEQEDKAFAFFKMAIDYYPTSSNAQDSMAEYYSLKSDFTNAIKHLEKAFELSKNVTYQNKIKALKEKTNH